MPKGNNTTMGVFASDAEAIAASLADPAAFVALFDRHADQINRYLRRRVGSDTADELTSETFAQAFEHRARFDGRRADARPWLYGIAHNLLRHHYRTEERDLRAYARTGIDPTQHALDTSAGTLDGAPSTLELADALAQLSSEERDVLLLIAWGELDYNEVADALGIPLGTVRSRLNRARRRIRELLARPRQYEKETI